MSLNALLIAAEAEGHHAVVELPIPAIGYGVIAMAAFVVMLVVTMSFRHVAERHSHKHSAATAEAHHGH